MLLFSSFQYYFFLFIVSVIVSTVVLLSFYHLSAIGFVSRYGAKVCTRLVQIMNWIGADEIPTSVRGLCFTCVTATLYKLSARTYEGAEALRNAQATTPVGT